ncbi:MAG: hypothetical protein DIZ77_09240 [endosymbiont of Seepiophila jonesi]|uniref:Uncharacterized protein n=1 Tax=endosymbiont of Lamellibrachia luymesi TaxID=2200907 RepID=A0A370DAC1_9GAMM|nr:MAG: hypothetical protein DIZ79_18130 [endosymbiont of Lamellibrachia luymesi]RDH92100.1 MAG: hypothetical protein DIZ77_09240 [endosymbiont of Seepiophila jonesi]
MDQTIADGQCAVIAVDLADDAFDFSVCLGAKLDLVCADLPLLVEIAPDLYQCIFSKLLSIAIFKFGF